MTLELTALVEDSIARHGVPGASVAVRHRGSLVTAVAGTASRRSGLAVTPETLFQVGSIAKVYTATLVLRLVDEGLLDLQAKVSSYLPFVPWDVTVGQLLDHTSGLAADVLDDFGRGSDKLARYVSHLVELPLEHPVGAFYSYTNSGPVLAGRLIEVVTEQPFEDALRERLLAPLGLAATFAQAEDVMLHPFAVGHLDSGDVVPMWTVSHASAPAGSTLCATASDVVALAQLHLSDDGEFLSPSAVAAMREWRVAIPEVAPRRLGMGLGWHLEDIEGRLLLSHGGSTYGNQSQLYAVPEEDLAVVVLTNGGDGDGVIGDVTSAVLSSLAGIERPSRGEERARVAEAELDGCVGTFVSSSIRAVVSRTETGLAAALEPVGLPPELADQAGVTQVELVPLGEDRYLLDQPGITAPGGVVLAFLEPDASGSLQYLYMGRTLRREPAA
jgi:CubicO group peptidase (beta-lactamase class C family)